MADFDELTRGSAAAGAKGCTCRPPESDKFRPGNDCPLHGLEARWALEKFLRRDINGNGPPAATAHVEHISARPQTAVI
jgi:hypothetical protein